MSKEIQYPFPEVNAKYDSIASYYLDDNVKLTLLDPKTGATVELTAMQLHNLVNSLTNTHTALHVPPITFLINQYLITDIDKDLIWDNYTVKYVHEEQQIELAIYNKDELKLSYVLISAGQFMSECLCNCTSNYLSKLELKPIPVERNVSWLFKCSKSDVELDYL